MKVTCPTPDTLLELLGGTLANADQEAWEQHIETCVQCQDALASLTDADEVLPNIGPRDDNRAGQENPQCRGEVEGWDGLAVRLADVLVRQVDSEKPAPSNKDTSSAATESLPEIPGYEVHGLLGRGGMGAVYDAVHLRFQRSVAIKILPEATRANPEMLARFAREMASIGQLDHPNIVQAYDAAEYEGLHYLVMERVAGRTLSEIAKDVPQLNIADACEIIRQAAVGLQHAHLNGLIHRDIKPSNIMLSQEGVVKILDLGLARLTDDDDHSLGELTCTGQIIGTVDYMAPEQAAGRHDLGTAADIYSLGATLYRLLAGHVPFHGDDYRSILQKLNALTTQSPPSLHSIRPAIPKTIDSIVRRMMEKVPENRFSDVGQIVDALSPHCLHSNLSAFSNTNLEPRENAATDAEDTIRLEARLSTVSIAAEELSDHSIAKGKWRRKPVLVVTTFAFLLLATSTAALWSNRSILTAVIPRPGVAVGGELVSQNIQNIQNRTVGFRVVRFDQDTDLIVTGGRVVTAVNAGGWDEDGQPPSHLHVDVEINGLLHRAANDGITTLDFSGSFADGFTDALSLNAQQLINQIAGARGPLHLQVPDLIEGREYLLQIYYATENPDRTISMTAESDDSGPLFTTAWDDSPRILSYQWVAQDTTLDVMISDTGPEPSAFVCGFSVQETKTQ